MRASAPTRGSDLNSTTNRVSVYLNVYDLTTLNSYMYWLGFGIFHSGIEVYGVEYAFGAHDFSTTGVFEVEPRNCPGFIFRKSIPVGTTDMSPFELRDFIEQIAADYNGDTYHLIAKNCNHFSNDICMRLTGKSIPGWVNRLANVGACCNCLLPESLQVTAVHQTREERREQMDNDTDEFDHLLTAPNGEARSLMRDHLQDTSLKNSKDFV